MQNVSVSLRKIMGTASIGRIREVGKRVCESCGKEVLIMERTDRDGNKHTESTCLACENVKVRNRFPKSKKELERMKINNFALRYERVQKKLIGKTVAQFKAETDSERDMKSAVVEYITNFGNTAHHSLVLAGPMGLGKSHLAYAIGAELRRQGFITMFIRTDDFLELIRSTYNRESNLTEEMIFNMIEVVDLLIFDEIGAEYSNKKDDFETWSSEKIQKVVDLREHLPTVFTTNYGPADFERKYGAVQGGRIASRMKAGAKRIAVEGRDRREGDY